MVKYKGFQVLPSKLEAVVGQHPVVDEVCVTGIWDEDNATEVPCAYVVVHHGDSTNKADHNRLQKLQSLAVAQDILSSTTARAAEYRAVRGGVRLIDALPKSPTGKVLTRLLPKDAERGSWTHGMDGVADHNPTQTKTFAKL